jgi:predicted dehydrogenase
MDKIKVGLIGVGMVGKTYALQLYKVLVEGAELAAVCCRERQMEWVKNNLPEQVKIFVDEDPFFNDSGVDAVMIATPHYSHPDLAIKAFAKGMHVLLEKPSGVYTKNVAEMNKVAALSGKFFSIMFNQRTNPLYQKVRNLIQSEEIGEIIRTNWTYTNCYRTQTYYDSSKWRATWSGEGGGVLINQAAHPLDLWQWITGLVPKQVQAFCHEGKFHQMEAEDAVTAYVEFENGATGIFIASTGEEFGTNRLEIVGDKGKIVVENQTISLFRSNPDPECGTFGNDSELDRCNY